MKNSAKKSTLSQLEKGLESVTGWFGGKTKLRTTEIDASGNRKIFYQSYEDYQNEKNTGKKLRDIRQQLGLSQSRFANVMRTSVRTLQGWEVGKSVPTPALVLAELIRDSKDVRRRLMSADEFLRI